MSVFHILSSVQLESLLISARFFKDFEFTLEILSDEFIGVKVCHTFASSVPGGRKVLGPLVHELVPASSMAQQTSHISYFGILLEFEHVLVQSLGFGLILRQIHLADFTF
jgi:hypothetical protein